ncbi:MAG: hypothetical protein HQ498_14945 [Pseudohongiella sp.]|jgi:uncharacterized Zn finger protein|nr:hypothetical protein [Pseudohongiella sp.]
MGSRRVDIQCWKCGSELKNLLLPFSRYEECSTCNADLHACIACKNYNPAVADACREERADFVLEKDKANFCDFFKANPKPFRKQDNVEARQAKARLANLFGEGSLDTEENISTVQTEAEQALAELKRLFSDQSN